MSAVHGHLQELVTPLSQTLTTVLSLLCIGLTSLLEPLNEELFILLENQKLSKNDISLIEALFIQSLAQDFSNSSQVCHRFVTHGFRHKIVMFLRSRRHVAVQVVSVGCNRRQLSHWVGFSDKKGCQ